jgi:hypothetical protein
MMAVESVLAPLDSGEACWSTVTLQNLGSETVLAELEAHRASGALVPLPGHPDIAVRLKQGGRETYKLDAGAAWVKVREAARRAPVIAVSGQTECVIGEQLRTAAREVAYAIPNPWISADVTDLGATGLILLVNTSGKAATASACYSAGALYSTGGRELTPVCSRSDAAQIPPFGTHLFPVEREGNSHFSLRTQGEAIVLEMLRPLDPRVKLFSVDSTIHFEK